VAAILLVLSLIVPEVGNEWLIADVSLWDVHIQTWMLFVFAIFLFGFVYVWRQQQDQHQSVDEPQEYHSLKSAVSDHSPFLADGAPQIAYQISKRRDKLARLHQDLDRLLQHGPQQAHDVAMAGVAG
jgi:hypothetical protein